MASAGADERHVRLVRHGETEWSRDGRHTGRSEVELTPAGVEQARALAPWAASMGFDRVLCSPRLRAQRTAELAGLAPFEVSEDLREWDYGDLEGLTTPEIRQRYPGWTIWSGPWPGGETAADVAGRADRLLARLQGSGAARVVLVGHGHFGRVLGARWARVSVEVGQWLQFDTACWSQLGWDRGVPVLSHWNVPVNRSVGT
jgi:broad specificity phosphatase PhoE